MLLAVGCRGRRAEAPRSREPAARTDAAAAEVADDAAVRYQVFPDERAALRHVLASNPRIVGVGEVHQSTASAPVRSTAARFTEMLDVVAPAATDLVVETWVQTGRCGPTERVFDRNVTTATRRPATTRDEVSTLLREAQRRGVAPHVLTLDCHDYLRLMRDGGEVDLEGLALVLGRQLRGLTERLYATRAAADGGAARGAVWIYGGALHNDLFPEEDLASMSYAGALSELAGGRYVELDLYVPEYVAGNPIDMREPWYPVFERLAGPDRVLLIERGPGSFILVFRTRDAAVNA